MRATSKATLPMPTMAAFSWSRSALNSASSGRPKLRVDTTFFPDSPGIPSFQDEDVVMFTKVVEKNIAADVDVSDEVYAFILEHYPRSSPPDDPARY